MTDTICTEDYAACLPDRAAREQRRFATGVADLVRKAFGWILALEDKRLSRLALSEMTDSQLADIGITRAEARREAARPFWN